MSEARDNYEGSIRVPAEVRAAGPDRHTNQTAVVVAATAQGATTVREATTVLEATMLLAPLLAMPIALTAVSSETIDGSVVA